MLRDVRSAFCRAHASIKDADLPSSPMSAVLHAHRRERSHRRIAPLASRGGVAEPPPPMTGMLPFGSRRIRADHFDLSLGLGLQAPSPCSEEAIVRFPTRPGYSPD